MSTMIVNNDPNVVNEYYRWLCRIVSPRKLDHSLLFHDLHSREFYWLLPMDENRAKDGKYLRYAFGEDVGLDNSEEILAGPCSIFEMLIGLAGRWDGSTNLDFNNDKKQAQRYFWVMLDNLGLKYATDEFYEEVEVHHILDRWMFREFDEDGTGGLFPLHNPKLDQREVEIWKQKEAYLIENYNFEFD